MTAATLLRALGDLESSLRPLGIDLAAHGAPGASDQDLERIADVTGVDLPEEARAWFQWHNGTTNPNFQYAKPLETSVGPCWYLTSIDTALDDYASIRNVVAESFEPEGIGYLIPAHLFPIVVGTTGGTIVIHTDGPHRGAVDIVSFRVFTFPGERTPPLPSLTRLIELFASAVRDGVVTVHPAGFLAPVPRADLPADYRNEFFY